MSREVDLSPLANYTMPSGVGCLELHQACVVAQAAILDKLSRGEEITVITDTLECACPVLRVLAIALNDIKWWESDRERQETLNPLRLLLLDSRRDLGVTAQRAEKAAVFAKYAAQSSAKYAAKSAEYAAKSAEYAAKYAAQSSAEYAAYPAQSAAWYAAKYAAESAAEYAQSAQSAAEYAVKSLRTLRDELLRVWMTCEALQ